MSTEEHLNKIVAKCRELLAIAEKRTPGKWMTIERHVVKESDDDVVASADGDFMSAEMDERNAAFIANCAGPAEAGWRATIAAIDMLQKDYESLNDAGNKDGMRVIQWRMAKIIAAWPQSLLS